MHSLFYNAHHAPAGAYFTVTLGSKGGRGGLGCELGHPSEHSVYIAFETEDAGTFEALPFFKQQVSDAETFGITEVEKPAAVRFVPFADERISRTYTPCTDVWTAGQISFSLFTPVYRIPDPLDHENEELFKTALMPVVAAELEVDNRSSSQPRRAVIGFTGDGTAGMRHLAADGLCGIGQGRRFALCTSNSEARSAIGFTAEDILSTEAGHFGLGNTALLVVTVPAGAHLTIPLVFCCYRDGPVTAGIEGRYVYTRYFSSVADVARQALDRFDELRNAAAESDGMLYGKKLSPERAFMLAHAVHSYYGCTQCLDTDDGVRWVVNEGEYRMINTLDLAADHLFYELLMHPWVVRSIIGMYRNYYACHDTVKSRSGDAGVVQAGGISFTHDMGVANVFSAPGISVYERRDRNGCFSYMTHEELVNWILCATVYVLYTRDSAWAEEYAPVLEACCTSLVNRDDADSGERQGYMQHDSSLTGTGSEITTYDSLDRSLGRARGNSYVAVKRWAAFVLLHRVFSGLENGHTAQLCMDEAVRTADRICRALRPDGTIPSLLDGTEAGISLVVTEGLIYPWFAGCRELFAKDSQFAPMLDALRRHCLEALTTTLCIGPDSGWTLTSSSDITWLSKLYLFRFIATDVLGLPQDEAYGAADNAHYGWLMDEKNGFFAWSDQFRRGTVVGSRYYPRGVTAVLWLLEGGAAEEESNDTSLQTEDIGQQTAPPDV